MPKNTYIFFVFNFDLFIFATDSVIQLARNGLVG